MNDKDKLNRYRDEYINLRTSYRGCLSELDDSIDRIDSMAKKMIEGDELIRMSRAGSLRGVLIDYLDRITSRNSDMENFNCEMDYMLKKISKEFGIEEEKQ